MCNIYNNPNIEYIGSTSGKDIPFSDGIVSLLLTASVVSLPKRKGPYPCCNANAMANATNGPNTR